MDSVILDNRKLHVSTRYTKWENASPAEIFKQTSDRIREHYLRQGLGQLGVGGGSFDEAEKLNEFFQALKSYSRGFSNDYIDQAKSQVILSVLSRARAMRGHNTQKLLSQDYGTAIQRGDAAERDVAIIMQSVFDEVGGKQSAGDYGKMILGGELVNINFSGVSGMSPKSMSQGLEKFAQEMVRAGAKKLYDKVLKEQDKNNFVAVQGKIDVSGLMATVEVDVNASPYLIEIAQLLNKANFSIKSYTSHSFDKELKEYVSSKVKELHLGHTEQKRIFLDILQQEGVPQDVALSMLYYAKHTQNKSVKKQANNLIFTYELTGYGQKYINKAIQDTLDHFGVKGANYFIYNDPSTADIHVVSVAEIIQKIWNQVDTLLEKGATNLQKSFFNTV